MKRLMIALVLIIAALGLAASAALGGSSYDPLISLDYMQKTYLPEIERRIAEEIAAGLEPAWLAASDRLDSAAKPGIAGISAREEDMATAVRFLPLPVKAGDVLHVQGGGTVIITSGAGKLVSGMLHDLTDGVTCPAGSVLLPRHRYLADGTGRAAITLTGALGGFSVQGNYRLAPSAVRPMPFDDVPAQAWFFAATQFAFDSGLMSGVGETVFSPGGTMTRAMVATVLHRMQGAPHAAVGGQYLDVAADLWYTAPIHWAAEQGIVNGLGDGLFGPERPVTREQLAVMLHRYAVWQRQDVTAAATPDTFADGSRTAVWAQQAVAWAVASGIIAGRDDGTLDPNGTATRAEVATILFRFSVWSAAKT